MLFQTFRGNSFSEIVKKRQVAGCKFVFICRTKICNQIDDKRTASKN